MLSSSYLLVPNSDLHNIVNSFDDYNLSLNPSLSGNARNREFNLVYDIETKEDFASDSSDGLLQPRLIMSNSYSGNSSIVLNIGLFRFICSNFLVIPYADKVVRFKAKHLRSNSDLLENIHGFLRQALNEEAFTDIRDMILMSKQATGVKTLKYSYLVNMPYRMLFPILAGIYKFSQIPVIVEDRENNIIYDLHISSNVENLITRIVKERTDPEASRKVDGIGRFEDSLSMKYTESVDNYFQLYNLALKIGQYVVEKERRIAISQEIGKHFLTSGGYNG